MWCYILSEPQHARPQCLKVWLQVFQCHSTSSDFQRLYLQNAWDPETGEAHKRFSVHFYHRICGAAFYQSLRKFDCKCFRSRALLVTSSNNIFKTHGIQRLAMLTNDSACISTIGICGATIYQSLRKLDCKCFRATALLVTSSDDIFNCLGFRDWWCSQTIQRAFWP